MFDIVRRGKITLVDKFSEVGSTEYKSTAVQYRGTFLVPLPVPMVLFQKWYRSTGTAVLF